jgi:hypothetical protein
MASNPTTEKGHTIRPAGNDGGTGLVDTVSFLSLGHVFVKSIF